MCNVLQLKQCTIHEQNLLKGCFPSPNDMSFSINRDILEAEQR